MVYLPPDHPPNVPADEDGHEEWSEFIDRWTQDLRNLHDEIIPEDCFDGDVLRSRLNWTRFLSACVMYDPPDQRLEEFAAKRPIYRMGLGETPYFMSAAPIRWMKDHGAVEDAWIELFNRFVDSLIERYEQEPEKEVTELIRDTIGSHDYFAPVREFHRRNPSLPFIEVKPWHTEEDIRNAFRMIRENQENRPRRGRPQRDHLQAVQCAIFADRYGWTEDQVSEHYGWKHYGKAGKYIREGRRILNDS